MAATNLLVCWRMGSWLAVDLGQFETGATLADAALAIDPLNPEAHQARGDVRSYVGDLDGAEREYRACLQISPTFAFVHRELGYIYLRRKQPEAALEEMKLEGSDMAYRSGARPETFTCSRSTDEST